MKIFSKPPLYMFFGVFLAIGFMLGTSAAQSKGQVAEVSPPVSTPAPATSTAAPNGQHNLLVIGIDNLEAESPRLESIWMILYIPPTPQFTLIPIYPSPYAGGEELQNYLESTFALGKELKPDPAFLVAVQSVNIWWDNYIILDETAMANVVNTASSENAMNNPDFGSSTIANLPLAWEEPETAVLAQAELLNGLCHDFARTNSAKKLNISSEIFSNHVNSDLSAAQLTSILQSMTSIKSEPFRCQFPTINDALKTLSSP